LFFAGITSSLAGDTLDGIMRDEFGLKIKELGLFGAMILVLGLPTVIF
jgi:hypothetical protein